MRLLVLLSSLLLKGLCFSLLELGVPIESIIHSQHRESFLVNEVGKLDNLIVQLNLRYGRVQFGVDIYNKTRNYMTANLNNYKWHSSIFSAKDDHQIEENQINIKIQDIIQYPSNKQITNKLKKYGMNLKLIITIEAHLNSKYKLVTANDRIFLKANSSIEFVLPQQNSTISYVVEASNFFLLNAFVKQGQMSMKVNRLSEELQISGTSTGKSHQQISMSEIVKDSDLMFDQIVKDKESLQIGNKRKGIMQYIVTFQNINETPINIIVNWSNIYGSQIQPIQYNSETFYGKLFSIIFGNSGNQGKQMVKICIMTCLVVSFLMYAIVFVCRNMSTRKYKPINNWDEDEEDRL